jgi:acyl carrier protein
MEEKVNKIFAECLGVDYSVITPELEYASIPEWDSIAHMTIIAELEFEFDIMIDTDDVIDMSTVSIAYQTVRKYSENS